MMAFAFLATHGTAAGKAISAMFAFSPGDGHLDLVTGVFFRVALFLVHFGASPGFPRGRAEAFQASFLA